MKKTNSIDKLSFTQKVWCACSLIPKGKVSTYQELARFLGQPNSFRAVGNALNKNLDIPGIPCHRVINSSGELGGYVLGVKKKIALLNQEGIQIEKNHILNLNKVLITAKELKQVYRAVAKID
ncbi:MAG: MGMT family protein [Candidatus Diapherotrites archaeon]|nr:MGMT family protein [Candidatus Diapherotrites archaeon]